MINYWTTWGQSYPLHVVKYENLVEDTSREVLKMLQFLGIDYNEEEVIGRLQNGFR